MQESLTPRFGEGLFDVLIVGGGIVGAGVARDAAMRGLKVGLVEQYDFAAGTSSRSSRLLHGGIRYLAQGRIRMVHEASREKKILGEIAPHLVSPLAFVFPTYRGLSPARWRLGIGGKLYDLLCKGRNFGPSRSYDTAGLEELVPGLSADRLTGGARYYDALTNDARLVFDSLRSAAKHGAVLRNYTRFVSARREGGEWLVELEGGETVRTRTIVNAAGPWADRLDHSRTTLRPTKGVHLVIERDRLPVADAVVMREGKRILFAIPWGERVILGTTDTDVEDVLAEPRCEPADRDYILGVVNRSFPGAALEVADVRSTWAGLRPLVANWRGNPSDISRNHKITQTEPGWWDVTGGKLTTYRLMAEQTVDQLAKHLAADSEPCRTDVTPLVEDLPVDGISGVLPPPVTREAVAHYCRNEWAQHLDDVMIRRTGWCHYEPDADAVTEKVLEWMSELLEWDAERVEAERIRYRERRPTMPN